MFAASLLILSTESAGGQSQDIPNGQTWQETQQDTLVRVTSPFYNWPLPEPEPDPKIGNLYVLAEAIKEHEGFYPGSVAYDNNNPGNLRRWPTTQVGTNRGFAVFPSYEVGYQALLDLLITRCDKGWTLYQLMSWYAPSSDNNNPRGYASMLANELEVGLDTKLANIYCTEE